MSELNGIVVKNITEAVTVYSPQGRKEQMENRARYGITFCIEGQITYVQNGKKFVSDKKHALILPEGGSYAIIGDKKGYFPVINFTCENFYCKEIMELPISGTDSYIDDFEKIKSLFLFERNRNKVISIFYNILHKLCIDDESAGGILTPAIKYIEKNYNNPALSNRDLARECNISEVYFRKLFSERFGLSPRQYIIDIRIDKAKQLLSDGMYKINVISEKSGFSNPYHFSRVFKDKTGLTPTEYMKINRVYKI